MEDYEKAYKEALERAKKNYDTAQDLCESSQIGVECFKNTLTNIFPELKESEDERIRKALVRFHKSTIDIDGIKGADILAWLEKQGNNTPTIIWHNIDEKPEEMKELFCEWESDDATWHDVAFYDEESHTFRHAKMPINVTKWVYVDELLEKQGEQKPVDKVEPFDKYEGLTDFERTLADICIGWIGEELGWKQYIKDNADVLLKIAIEMFNSIQDAPFEQKSAAWSDEDEKMYKIAFSCIETLEDISNGKNMHADVKEWLKSLKNRIGG